METVQNIEVILQSSCQLVKILQKKKNYPQKTTLKNLPPPLKKAKKQNIEFDEKEYKNVIIKFIKENNNITKNDIAEKLDITKDGVKYHLKKLVKDGYIKYVGTSKNGYWKILKLY